DGYMKEVVDDSGAAVCVPLGDVAGHEKALRVLYRQYERKKLKPVPQEFAEQFNRVTLTGELAKQFESLMDLDRHPVVKIEERVA
ncbi:MAG TPA: hypothetical protein VII11_04880, partial [Bacteroidota bacterium]